MPSEVRKTPRNKVIAEQQFAAQIAELMVTPDEFIVRSEESGFVYKDSEVQVCTQYTIANAPETFEWFSLIIRSLTSLQINTSNLLTCPLSGVLPTEPTMSPTSLPTQNIATSFTSSPVAMPVLPGQPNRSTVHAPVASPSPEPTPTHNQEWTTYAPYPSSEAPNDTTTSPVLSTGTVKPSTESPVEPSTSLKPNNGTEIVPISEPNNAYGSFYETTPFISMAVANVGTILVGIAVACYCWKKNMAKNFHYTRSHSSVDLENLDEEAPSGVVREKTECYEST
jgi:hypothetical protein